MLDDQTKYWQAYHRQQWDKLPNRIVLIERLHDCYKLTTANGIVTLTTLECGAKLFPVALCGN
jgi:hypothetical protein